MNPLQERRFISGLLLFVACVLLISIIIRFAWGDALGGVPFPRHVEWTQYTVPEPGWTMCRPASDSTEVCIPLSPGTEVYVPRFVPGADPKGEADARMRKASR